MSEHYQPIEVITGSGRCRHWSTREKLQVIGARLCRDKASRSSQNIMELPQILTKTIDREISRFWSLRWWRNEWSWYTRS